MAVMGRSSMVWVCYRSPYARSDEGLGRPFTKNLTRREIAIASVSALGIALFLLGAKGALVFLASAIFSFGHRLFFLKKLGGVTGDVLGSANELTELLSILLLVILERF
jgi:adenosylcobinamide-GDP ribazoletransferase